MYILIDYEQKSKMFLCARCIYTLNLLHSWPMKKLLCLWS